MKTWSYISVGWLSLIVGALVSLPASSFAADDKSGAYEGSITSVSLNDQTVTVRRGNLSKQFKVTSQTSIVTQEKKTKATLADLRTGFDVEVTYSEKDGVAQASAIVEKAPAEEKK